MAFRCEDAPCCGCFSDPRGCVDRDITLTCSKCRTQFHPDAYSGKLCLRCEVSGKRDLDDDGCDDGDDDGGDDDREERVDEDCGFFGYEGMRED